MSETMNINNIQGTDKQGGLLVPSKITDDNKTNKLQQIEKASQEDAVIVSQGEQDTNKGIYTESLDNTEEKSNETEKKEEPSLEDASNKMTEKDFENLKEEGFSFESFEAGRLNRALLRIKENKEFFENNIATRVENKKETEETIKKIAIGNKYLDPMAKKLAQKLVDANMPVTDDNINSLINAMSMIGSVANLSDSGKAYLIDNNLEPTIKNIYHSQYSTPVITSMSMNRKEMGENGFKSIEKQVDDIIKDAGMEVSKESKEQAKWLYNKNLPITKENLNALQALEKVKENANEDLIIEKMSSAMGKGLRPEETNLDETNEAKLAKVMKDIKNLTINIEDNTDIATITAKRQLEEIRLKLTTEVGMKLISKGIKLDTKDLQGIVDGLKQIEKEYYKGLFIEASKTPTEDEVSLLQTTTNTVNALKEAPNYILGTTLKQREIQTVGSLHDTAVSMKVQLDKAGVSYEALMTTPRSDMGDSIQKAFQNIPDILNEVGLEDTQANKRAVRILSYNQMEINKEMIGAVKSYDSKVNNLLKELKPAVTVELIKRNINPLTVNLEELTKEVASIRKEVGVSKEEKYSEYLWKLEKNNAISEKERSSYIGIYRLLNNVEKTDGAAIGAVLNNGMQLTLKNLLSAVRSKKASGINVSVDDTFGSLTSLEFKGEQISNQIEASFQEHKPLEVTYYQEVLSRIIDEVSPEKLRDIFKNGVDGLMDMSLEKLEDNLEQVIEDNQINSEYASYRTMKLQEIAKTSKEAVAFLENFQIEPSIKNIVTANAFYTNGKSFFKNFNKNADKEYNELISDYTDAIEDADTLKGKFEKVEEKVKNLIQEEYKKQIEDESSAKVEELRIFANGIELARKLCQQEYYQIPIKTGSQVTTMNLTLRKGTSDSGKISVSMDSEEYGKLEGEFTVKDVSIKGFIMCNSKDGLEVIESAKDYISKGFEELGLEVKQLTIGYDKEAVKKIKPHDTNNEPSTRLLYQTAKVLVKALGDVIQKDK